MRNPRPDGVLRRARFAVGAGTLALLLASCSWGDDAPETKPLEDSSSSATPPDPALASYYEQEPTWRECRSTMECTEVEVPLDYADPEGESISLSVLRVPARDADDKVGSLLVNPGGPGGSGVDYAAAAESYFGEDVRDAFDIVGFDPRGVGASTPVDCAPDERLDAFVASDPDPETPAEVREAVDYIEELGAGCLERSGDLARHMSTEEAARDMDVLRAVLGQESMAYFGASYGTYLGATYADLFPERVGRMVLDGAVDPMLDDVEASLVQAEGFEVALRAYVGACVDDGECFLGDTVDEGTERIRAFLDELDQQPIPGDGERDVTEGRATLGIWAPLYNKGDWGVLDVALQQAFGGDGRTLLLLSDAYVRRGPEGYADNSLEALYAVNCADPHEEITVQEAAALEDEFLEASPTFGRGFAFGLSACGYWPVEAPAEQELLDAPGADPILVVGTSRDPATPLAWAEALADQLESGVLVRRDGDGHTGYTAGNECVDEAVESYLVAGEVPEDGLDC